MKLKNTIALIYKEKKETLDRKPTKCYFFEVSHKMRGKIKSMELSVEAFGVKDGVLLLNKQPFKCKGANCVLHLKNWSETDKLR